MSTLTALKDFIAKARVQKVLTIILHTMQVTHPTSLFKVQLKTIFDIGHYHLAPSMPIVLFVYALRFQRAMSFGKHQQQFKQGIPIENSWQKLDFLNMHLVIIQIS
jgi:hypothetical protein